MSQMNQWFIFWTSLLNRIVWIAKMNLLVWKGVECSGLCVYMPVSERNGRGKWKTNEWLKGGKRWVIVVIDSRPTGDEVTRSEVKGGILWVVTFRLWPPQRFTVFHPETQRLEDTSQTKIHFTLFWSEKVSWDGV